MNTYVTQREPRPCLSQRPRLGLRDYARCLEEAIGTWFFHRRPLVAEIRREVAFARATQGIIWVKAWEINMLHAEAEALRESLTQAYKDIDGQAALLAQYRRGDSGQQPASGNGGGNRR